ncbi:MULTISPECIES: alpha/beta hydrolase [unclassified Cryobacterium]|uniref:alpha/beta hydrolase n=1 Tax=unclassified Cryobacterium TaxID=2649013 RepID=UPI002AB4BA87|nr:MULTISPECIES: alpha/beta hydrolase-fold protein [unclassified Cryobacterium]MDY7541750.1 alpha/beta hydrolase-fold protein [Cryobacterium sp. 5B3]MEB0000192.1 alpha/beta hydrolase-fold protein [Cryobacterium sp. RTS3]MEB0266664.1 alpha/beta hydrolase-fold protein [Cryobacterium sp. 10I5]MEB0275861.1 alpha/beta hydrolase-fold protein [Cryobacterium sp. 5B3]
MNARRSRTVVATAAVIVAVLGAGGLFLVVHPASAASQASQPAPDASLTNSALPITGTVETVHIPATASGFSARDAEVYLPPAAQIANAPALPFVLMMMGQPGNPDASYIGSVLDTFALTHNGQAPIVVVADQLGDPSVDSLCLDTPAHGNVQTYIEQDVVNWARANLRIMSNRVEWTVAGFSNGGQCAISLAARFPDVWGNVISASGTTFAGTESEPTVLADVFGGDQAAYDETKPATVMSSTSYPDTDAVFTVGADDFVIGPPQKELSTVALGAGMATSYYEVPGEGHTIGALLGGLTKAFEVLAPRLGFQYVPPQP